MPVWDDGWEVSLGVEGLKGDRQGDFGVKLGSAGACRGLGLGLGLGSGLRVGARAKG